MTNHIFGSGYLSLRDHLFGLRVEGWRSIFLGLDIRLRLSFWFKSWGMTKHIFGSGLSRYLSLRDSVTFVPSSFIFKTLTCDQICSFQLPFEFFNMKSISEATRSKIECASALGILLGGVAVVVGLVNLIIFAANDNGRELVNKWFAYPINN